VRRVGEIVRSCPRSWRDRRPSARAPARRRGRASRRCGRGVAAGVGAPGPRGARAGPFYVAVHDVARALVPAALIARVLDAARAGGARARHPALPLRDTVKEVEAARRETLPRARLQGPDAQIFAHAILARAHAVAGSGAPRRPTTRRSRRRSACRSRGAGRPGEPQADEPTDLVVLQRFSTRERRTPRMTRPSLRAGIGYDVQPARSAGAARAGRRRARARPGAEGALRRRRAGARESATRCWRAGLGDLGGTSRYRPRWRASRASCCSRRSALLEGARLRS